MRRHRWTGSRDDHRGQTVGAAAAAGAGAMNLTPDVCPSDGLQDRPAWLAAGRQPKGKESATCSTLPAPSPPPVPRQNTVTGRKECGISKTCFRATQGESLEVGVAVGVSLVVIYARFLILPTSRHSPSASPPVHAANRFALWSTFCQFANATYDLLSSLSFPSRTRTPCTQLGSPLSSCSSHAEIRPVELKSLRWSSRNSSSSNRSQTNL